MPTRVAIIVLNWQQPQLTIDTVDSLFQADFSNIDYHLFLVDNGSTDNSLLQLQKHFGQHPHVSLLHSPANLMFVGGNNFALRQISLKKFDYVLLLNNDVILDSQFLTQLVSFANHHPKIGAVGPKIYFAPHHEFHQHYKKNQIGKVIWSFGGVVDWNNLYAHNQYIDQVDTGQFNQIIVNPDFVSGCCLLIRTKILEHFLLDEAYTMYLEDVDFCQKVKQLGFKLAVIPQSNIWHINAGSTTAGGGPLHDYFLTRNRLIFGFRYATLKTKFALFRQSLSQFFHTTPWQRRGIIDFYLHRWGRGSWR